MILHSLFAVNKKVMARFICRRVCDTHVAQPPSAVALVIPPLPFYPRLRGAVLGADLSGYRAGLADR
jgi:hypothetical protein